MSNLTAAFGVLIEEAPADARPTVAALMDVAEAYQTGDFSERLFDLGVEQLLGDLDLSLRGIAALHQIITHCIALQHRELERVGVTVPTQETG